MKEDDPIGLLLTRSVAEARKYFFFFWQRVRACHVHSSTTALVCRVETRGRRSSHVAFFKENWNQISSNISILFNLFFFNFFC